MKLRHEWETHDSKLATFVSFLKGGVAGFIFFLLIFFIPAFICLIVGVEGSVVGILFGVLGVAAIITYVLFLLFVDPHKIDKVKNKKQETQLDKTEQFFISLYDTAKSTCPSSRSMWDIDFVLYALFKARIILISQTTNKDTSEETKQDIVYAFDTISAATLKKRFSYMLPAKLQAYYQTRIGAYDTIYAYHENDPLIMAHLSDCLKWFLFNSAICIPNGSKLATPYNSYFFPNKVLEFALSEEELAQVDELELQTLNFLEKNIEDFILTVSKNKK